MPWPFISFAKESGRAPTGPDPAPLTNGRNRAVDAALLKPHPLLSLLPRSTLDRLLQDPAIAEYDKGTVIFREGDPASALYLIISGRCESRVRSRVGSSAFVVEEVFGPGDTLGERALLNREPHRATVLVATHCVLLRIPAEELIGIFDRDPSVAGRFSRTVTERVRMVRERQTGKSAGARRLVALCPLSGRIDSPAVARKLGRSLRQLTGQSVLLVHLSPARDGGGAFLDDWPQLERSINGEFCFRSAICERDGVSELRLMMGSDGRSTRSIAPMLSHCGCHYDYVLVLVEAETPPLSVIECIIQTDLAYVMVHAGVQSLYDFELLMRQVGDEARGNLTHVKPILFAEQYIATPQINATLRGTGCSIHSFVRGFPVANEPESGDPRFNLHINSLAREIARRRVGIAFSSGGAKGLAHVGVIQVLEELGVEVDVIAGASMGAYIGAVWAYGFDGAMLEKLAREQESRWGLWGLVDPVLPPRQGFIRTRKVVRRLRRSIGEAHFSDLIRPLRVVATRLDTLERVVFSSGEVAEAVAASIAIPGVVVPVQIENDTYIDGGIADPLPVDVLEELGIENIIAVNVIPPPERLRQWMELAREPNGRENGRRRLRDIFSHRVNYFAPGNILDTMLQAVTGAQMRVAEAAALRADILIRPLACDAFWHDFTHPGKYIALGRKAAEEQLPALKALALQNAKQKTDSMAVTERYRAA